MTPTPPGSSVLLHLELEHVVPAADALLTRPMQRLTTAAYRSNNHETPLTFEGKSKPGSAAASASASGVADNILRALGLKNGDVTAAAVVLWRIKTVWDLHGQAAAMSISGRSEVAHICNRIYPAGLPRIPSAVEEPAILRF